MPDINAVNNPATIKPATFAEIQVEPRLGWLPVSTVEAWVNDVTRARGGYALERSGAFLTLAGVDYLDQTALRYRVFRDLWAVRTLLIQRSALPPLERPEAYHFVAADAD